MRSAPASKERTLCLLPGYRLYVTAQNQANFRAEQGQRTVKPPTYETLTRLLAKARAHRTPLLFVASPRPSLPENPATYSVSEEAIRLITAAGVRYL